MSNIPEDIRSALQDMQNEVSTVTAQLLFQTVTGKLSKADVMSRILLKAAQEDDWVNIAAAAQTISTMDRIETKLKYKKLMKSVGVTKEDPKLVIGKLPNSTLSELHNHMVERSMNKFLVASSNQIISKEEVEAELKLRGMLK